MQDADLTWAVIFGIETDVRELWGADFSLALNLTQDQIDKANLDCTKFGVCEPRLPAHLKMKKPRRS
jgi:hypothetical protein